MVLGKILKDHVDLLPQGKGIETTEITAVQAYGSRRGIVEAAEELDESRLSRPVLADQGDHLTGGDPEEVFEDFWDGQEVRDDVREFAEALVRGTHRERPMLDDVISSSTEHWRVERMSVVDRNVLRLAAYEMLFEPDTPPVVVIDETPRLAFPSL